MIAAPIAAPIAAQSLPPRSLLQDPQQGATPRPLPASPPLPPVIGRDLPDGRVPAPAVPVLPPLPTSPIAPIAGPPVPPGRPDPPVRPGALPVPMADPMHLDPATDPVLQLSRAEVPRALFRDAIATAVARNPSLDEAEAQADEAEASRNEARSRQYPVADISFSNFDVLSRHFSGDLRNVLERSRPRGRTDTTVRVQQPVWDFGAARNRIEAGNARLRAAEAGIEDTGTQVALRAIDAWYNVYAYRALVRLGEAFAASQRDLRGLQEQRIAQGYAALGDLAQVDSYIASSDAQLADFRRQAANAEAQYRAILGQVPPNDLGRAPTPEAPPTPLDAAEGLPAVRAARLVAEAARRDLGATRADQLPSVSVGLDAGRYGVFETAGDYDVRANVTLSMRLGGGAKQRVDQAAARAGGAEARYRRILVDSSRDADIAMSDLEALQQAQDAMETNYVNSRRSRDVLVERFRVSRGTLFDVLTAENNYFGVAARYIQTVTELDTARYVLLARTGRLLPALGIRADTLRTPS